MAGYGWHVIQRSETSPFGLAVVSYYDDHRHVGTGFAVAQLHGYGPRGLDFDVITRETPSRKDAERAFAAYDRDYPRYNDEELGKRYGKVAEGGWMSGQITSRESRSMAGQIVSQEDREHRWRSGTARAISYGLDKRFNHLVSSSKHYNLHGSDFIDVDRDFPWRTIDIVPDGDSPVSAPTFQVWYDGSLETHTYEDFDGAVMGAFYEYAWPGGDPVGYYAGDDDILCGECAAQEWIESGVAFKPEVEHDEYGQGFACVNQGGDHEGWITEPCCVDCRKTIPELFLADTDMYYAYDVSEPHFLCRDCLESLVDKDFIAPQEVVVVGNRWIGTFVTVDPQEWFMEEDATYKTP